MATGQRLSDTEVTFPSENEKEAFKDKVDAAKKFLLPHFLPHSQRETYRVLSAMLDRVLHGQAPECCVAIIMLTKSGLSLLSLMLFNTECYFRLIHAFTRASMLPQQFL